MAVGRNPVPTALRELRGNPGKRPYPKDEARPVAALPPAPRHLDAVARGEWRRTGALLRDLGLLTNIDRAAFEAYCVAYSRWREAEKAIADHGLVILTPNRMLIQSPYVGIANTAMGIMRGFLAEFGMTPVSRTKAARAEPAAAKADPLDELLNRRRTA